MKKTAAVLLAIVVLIGVAATAAALPEYVSGIYTYTINDDGSALITGYSARAKTVTIPEVLSNRAVTGIADGAFQQRDTIRTIIIPASIRTIGPQAFSDCPSLAVFEVSPENPAFSSIDGVLFRKEDRTLLLYPPGKMQPDYTVPYGITAIGNNAFASCSALQSVIFPSTLLSIGDWAFSKCDSMRSFHLPDNLQTMGEGALSSCSALTAIEVSPFNPSFITIEGALYQVDTKTLLAYPAGLMTRSYSVPDGTLVIAAGAFNNCYTLSSVSLPDSILSIGDSAFAGCSGLSSISRTGSFLSGMGSAQTAYPLLTGNVLPNQLLTIGNRVFDQCTGLVTLGLPDSLQLIGEKAFDHCDSLTLIVPRDSYAYAYATNENIPYQYTDALDWLMP